LGERAKNWMDVLEGVVPLGELDAAYRQAFKKHASNFPINAFDIKNAYNESVVEREAQKIVYDYTPNCPHNHRDPKTATMQQVNPWNFDEDITMPCGFCRPNDYEQAKRDFINTSGEIKPLDILNNIVNGDFGKSN
jgi:hypothetical protein